MSRRHPTRDGLTPAGLERRAEAFAADRVLGWGLAAGGWWVLGAPAPSGPAAALAAVLCLGAVVEVGLALALGLRGVSPGTAARGLRLVRRDTGRPVGPGPALARAGITVVALLPTGGLGAAALAWSALTDPCGQRRGWHDRWTGAVLVDARAADASPVVAAPPAGLVNLTAMRLAPGPDVPTWRVRFAGGEEVHVEGPGLVGREPEGRPGEDVRHLVALDDPAVSKTHLRFHPGPHGDLVLVDRGSTNGSDLIRAGVSRALEPGRPTALAAGDVVALGGERMAVHREA